MTGEREDDGTGVFARLILALLLAVFAAPAAASTPACHDAPVAEAGLHALPAEHHGTPSPDDRALPAHLCIGCGHLRLSRQP